MLPKPVRELAASVEFCSHIALGAHLIELAAHRVVPPPRGTSGGIVIEADDYVTAIAGGKFREYRSELSLRRHLVRDFRGRHCRLLDLEAGSGARHEVTVIGVMLDTTVNIQTAIRGGLGARPPDSVDRRTCHS